MQTLRNLFYTCRIQLGFLLSWWGSRLLGFNVVLTYTPSEEDVIRAMHFAENKAQLNSSMRVYVEALDASYEKAA